MSTDINRIAELAKEDPKRQFYSIAHLITGEKLHEAFRSLRKDASAGIDGVTYEQYEAHVEALRRTSVSSIGGSKKANIGYSRCDESISLKRMGNRGRSRFPPSRIRIRRFRTRKLSAPQR
jgi:hypothetical protein